MVQLITLGVLLLMAAILAERIDVALSFSNSSPPPVGRRRAIGDLIDRGTAGFAALVAAGGGVSGTRQPEPASAANLPQSTGADMSRTGTVDALVPIVRIERTLRSARQQLVDAKTTSGAESPREVVKAISKTLSAIPSDQTLFKRIFDEYSDPVSYKQRFMDQNAFLVYYTKGYDGPNRPAMESGGDVPRQTLQYGCRNDAWAAFDEVLTEISFYSSDSSTLDDVLGPLERAITALEAYLSFALASDVDDARVRLR